VQLHFGRSILFDPSEPPETVQARLALWLGRSGSGLSPSRELPAPEAPWLQETPSPGGCQSGRVYALQYKNSLTNLNWTSLPLRAGNGGVLLLTDPAASDPERFYRVLRW
jgi:hypothetical protein